MNKTLVIFNKKYIHFYTTLINFNTFTNNDNQIQYFQFLFICLNYIKYNYYNI